MALTYIEILALIFSLAILFKLLMLIFSRNSWMSIIKRLYTKKKILFLVEIGLAAVVMYFLLQSLTLIEIMASIFLGAFLTGITFVDFSEEVLPSMLKVFEKKKFLKRSVIPIIIWLALAIWILLKIFVFG
jgi:hypothetical protein